MRNEFGSALAVVCTLVHVAEVICWRFQFYFSGACSPDLDILIAVIWSLDILFNDNGMTLNLKIKKIKKKETSCWFFFLESDCGDVFRVTEDEDVRLKILYCGICHSDFHNVKNEWKNSTYPILPGYVFDDMLHDYDYVVRFGFGRYMFANFA